MAFLFSDEQITDESFLEDINNLLNTGDVPNLYPTEDLIAVLEMCRPAAQAAGKALDGSQEALYAFFQERVKQNLHVCLCMSPIGDAFRNRLRQFPSMINCCTIDWFQEWPQDALEVHIHIISYILIHQAVADKFLADVTVDAPVKQALVVMCKYIHVSVTALSAQFLKKEKRHNYVTPTSYLELIKMFKKLLAKKRQEIMFAKNGTSTSSSRVVDSLCRI